MARGGSSLKRANPDSELLLFGASLLDASRAKDLRRVTEKARHPSEAIWVRGGRIFAVGPLSRLRASVGRAVARVDLGGGTITPGFTDSHIHLVTWIRALREPWIDAQDFEAIERAAVERIRTAPGEDWILLRGWIAREWPLNRRERSRLDRIAPDRPLVLFAVDGHSVWANGRALSRAGIDERSPNPDGGLIERDPSGSLTGALIEEARNLLTEQIERTTPVKEDLSAAIAKARSLGITSAHDFDRGATWRAAAELNRERRLAFRLLLSVPAVSFESAEEVGLATGLGGERLRVGAVKMFADGTLGSATALLEEPYEGSGGNVGIEVTRASDLARISEAAAGAGLSVAIHAIGDRAVRNALDAIESVRKAGKRFPLPPRVEHVQLSRPEDWSRFRALGALASVQPAHQLTDRPVARRHWGKRTGRSYAWRSLARAGARLIFGSDAPFDRAGPLRAIEAAHLRREPDDRPDQAFHPEQSLTLDRALRAHLETPHLAAGWTVPLGRLEPGWGADLAHFDQDLLTGEAGTWSRARALRVWIDGEEVRGRR
jgi:predicted amidohydrolase YtcJ